MEVWCAPKHDGLDGSTPLDMMFDTGDIVRFKVLKSSWKHPR